MTLSTGQALIIVALLALGTGITRFLPFVLFPNAKAAPAYIVYLGQMLPAAAISLLVVYCLKDISLTAAPHGLPEAIAIAAVTALHVWKKNTLLSIGGGTLIYMLLIQSVFI
ncbi:MAG: AzlD domain-containing protein [Clostridiales bacterium]|nr:AzlD domain-containing protein [Clostridiales bacterium]